MHDLITRVERYCNQHKLLVPKSTIIIGLSGGPDSVFLFHVLHTLRPAYELTLIAAHLDHGWRENSQQDMLFCKELAEKLNIEFVSAHASHIKLDRAKNGSQEELGRLLRRRFFEQVAASLAPFDFTQGERAAQKVAQTITSELKASGPGMIPLVALAHHQDDQIETFFLRLIRGSGLTGLAAMRPRTRMYIRPLLELSKAEICSYLDEHSIPYLIDYTNLHDTYLRNRIRKQVIPSLVATDPRFTKSCVRTIEHLQEADDFLEKLTQQTFDAISSKSLDGQYIINLKKFRTLEPFMRHRVLLYWIITEQVQFIPTQAFFDEIMKFLESPTGGKHRLHPTWSIIKKNQLSNIQKQID